MVYHGVRKVYHGVRKVYHGVRKVYHSVMKVYHGIRKVYHGVRKVYHGVQWTNGLAGLGGQGTVYGDKTTNKHINKQTDTSIP